MDGRPHRRGRGQKNQYQNQIISGNTDIHIIITHTIQKNAHCGSGRVHIPISHNLHTLLRCALHVLHSQFYYFVVRTAATHTPTRRFHDIYPIRERVSFFLCHLCNIFCFGALPFSELFLCWLGGSGGTVVCLTGGDVLCSLCHDPPFLCIERRNPFIVACRFAGCGRLFWWC